MSRNTNGIIIYLNRRLIYCGRNFDTRSFCKGVCPKSEHHEWFQKFICYLLDGKSI